MWGKVLISYFAKKGGGHYKIIFGVKDLKKCNITLYYNTSTSTNTKIHTIALYSIVQYKKGQVLNKIRKNAI